MKRRGGICIFVDEEEIEQMIEQNAAAGQGNKTITFSANTSFKSKTKANKCCYCGSDLQTQIRNEGINNNESSSKEERDKQMHRDYHKQPKLKIFHSSRWLSKNRKQSFTGCKCGAATGEFSLFARRDLVRRHVTCLPHCYIHTSICKHSHTNTYIENIHINNFLECSCRAIIKNQKSISQ